MGALTAAEAAALDMQRVSLTMGGVPIFSGGVFSLNPATEAALVKPLTRQALHAFELEFTHPATGELMRFVGAPPPDFTTLIARAFGVSDAVVELRSDTTAGIAE